MGEKALSLGQGWVAWIPLPFQERTALMSPPFVLGRGPAVGSSAVICGYAQAQPSRKRVEKWEPKFVVSFEVSGTVLSTHTPSHPIPGYPWLILTTGTLSSDTSANGAQSSTQGRFPPGPTLSPRGQSFPLWGGIWAPLLPVGFSLKGCVWPSPLPSPSSLHARV